MPRGEGSALPWALLLGPVQPLVGGTAGTLELSQPSGLSRTRSVYLGSVQGHGARGDSELQPLAHRVVVKKSSDSVPSCVAAEDSSHLMGLGSLAQLVDPHVVQDRLAVDGVLESFERRLQVLYAPPGSPSGAPSKRRGAPRLVSLL